MDFKKVGILYKDNLDFDITDTFRDVDENILFAKAFVKGSAIGCIKFSFFSKI